MRLTNLQHLPEPLAIAVAADPYDSGDSDTSATRLIDSPRLVTLRARHDDELTEDVADRIWSLLGQVTHGILDRAAKAAPHLISEERLFAEVNGWRVSGQIDLFRQREDGAWHLRDYKLTSVWKVILGGNVEWERQLNIYAALARRNGIYPLSLGVVVICRDWQRNKVGEHDYPSKPVVVVPVSMWPEEVAADYLLRRVLLHQQARKLSDQGLPDCTPQERWAKPDTWAVKKRGNKRALRVYKSEPEAETDAAGRDFPVDIEFRPGESTRCKGYCPVSGICSQWAEIQKAGHRGSEKTPPFNQRSMAA